MSFSFAREASGFVLCIYLSLILPPRIPVVEARTEFGELPRGDFHPQPAQQQLMTGTPTGCTHKSEGHDSAALGFLPRDRPLRRATCGEVAFARTAVAARSPERTAPSI